MHTLHVLSHNHQVWRQEVLPLSPRQGLGHREAAVGGLLALAAGENRSPVDEAVASIELLSNHNL